MKTDDPLIQQATLGDPYAAHCLAWLVSIAHLWDDLIDKDKSVTDSDINKVFMVLLTELPKNPWWLTNSQQMIPVIQMAVTNWHLATATERGKNNLPYEFSFICRSTYADLFAMTAMICGGEAHALDIAQKVRARAHQEGFKQYQQAVELEAEIRSSSDVHRR